MASADPLAADPSDPATFEPLARRLLRSHGLRVGDAVHDLVEIEIYAATGHRTVAALDEALGGRRVDDPGGPLQLVEREPVEAAEVIATARVGLTLARGDRHPSMRAFFGRPYRFLTEPSVAKGRVQTVLALHEGGSPPDAIRRRASSTRRAVERAIAAYERGQSASLDDYCGIRLPTSAWPEAYGAWVAATTDRGRGRGSAPRAPGRRTR